MIIPFLVGPNGKALKTTTQHTADRDRVVTSGLRKWFLEFSEFLTRHEIAMHCGLCRGTIATREGWRHWGECPGYRPPLDGATGQSVIKTTDGGLLWVGAKPALQIEMAAQQIEWFRQFSDVGQHFQFGLHCKKCEADVVGKNDDADAVYSVACRCREFIGANRDHQPEALISGSIQ